MKLFARYNRINLTATIVIFLLASVAFLFLLRYVFIDQTDEDLETKQKEIKQYLAKYNRLPEEVQLHDLQVSYRIEDASQPSAATNYKTANRKSERGKRQEQFREMTFAVFSQGQHWQVTVLKSLEGAEDLEETILTITVCTLLLILIVAFFINRFVLKKLWHPFYQTLQAVSDFKLTDNKSLLFNKTNVEEFDLLNKTLEQSVNKAAKDFALLKEFTENASHELQTPLAVIRSKLDLLIQDEHLTEQQSVAAGDAYAAIQKLSKINQSLLLLAKIENQQFTEPARVNLAEKTNTWLQQFAELWTGRNITIYPSVNNAYLSIVPALADILISNLFSNAIKHNISGGAVNITLVQGKLTISNTGAPQPLDTSRLFMRFYKQGAVSDNHGLGLSIVKQICEVADCAVSYAFNNGLHCFCVSWHEDKKL